MAKKNDYEKLIVIPAYLDMCSDCGEHGRIVMPASFSPEFVSKERGLRVLEFSLVGKRITKEEFWHLKQQIEDSGLPLYDRQASTLARLTTLLTNSVDEFVEAKLRRILENFPGVDLENLKKGVKSSHLNRLPPNQKWLM